MGEGSVTQSRYMQMVAERDMYKNMCEDIVSAVIDEGISPKYHRAVLKKHRTEWPFLWQKIDSVILNLREKNK